MADEQQRSIIADLIIVSTGNYVRFISTYDPKDFRVSGRTAIT